MKSLSRRLALLISLGFALIWVLALISTALVLKSEEAELLDQELRETARIFLPVLTRDYQARLAAGEVPPLDMAAPTTPDATNRNERVVYRLLDQSGQVLVQSLLPAETFFPPQPLRPGLSASETHVFYTTEPNAAGYTVQFGDPKHERREAFRESFLGFLVPMIAILPLAYLLVGWIARLSLRPLLTLQSEIALRGSGQLAPIETRAQPAELIAIIDTLNRFMARLSKSLENERAFATNAAHELRTPVAVALAQTQRLLAETTDGEARSRALLVEQALKRMGRLVARLLQLARAEAGIGVAHTPLDLRPVLRAVIADANAPDRIHLTLPDAPALARIDADAFAIIAGNLIDNALQYATAETAVRIVLLPDATLTVSNAGPLIPPDDLTQLTQRFHHLSKSGFGLGLFICETIARQAGGELKLASPALGESGGLEATLTLPAST